MEMSLSNNMAPLSNANKAEWNFYISVLVSYQTNKNIVKS